MEQTSSLNKVEKTSHEIVGQEQGNQPGHEHLARAGTLAGIPDDE